MENKENIDTKNGPANAPGVMTDFNSDVKIGLVHGGYFSSPERAKEFVDIFIKSVAEKLPKEIHYADLGCGEGFLGSVVTDFLQKEGYNVNTELVDGNPKNIEESKKTGYKCTLADLKDYKGEIPYDLISMRAVNHYNPLPDQEVIMANILANLKEGGFLVNQLSSGTDENCQLRNELVGNLPLIYGAQGKNYHWTSINEYLPLAEKIGFSDTKLVGYAEPNFWKPEDQWERMNGVLLKKALENKDEELVKSLEEHKTKYLIEANALVEKFISQYGEDKLGVKKEGDSYIINYQYPIFVSKK